jgi:hypothetical protein
MMRVQTCAGALANADADALNRERGRHDTIKVGHSRISRHMRHWLAEGGAQRLGDSLGGATILPAHRRDAAQHGCYMTGQFRHHAGLQSLIESA